MFSFEIFYFFFKIKWLAEWNTQKDQSRFHANYRRRAPDSSRKLGIFLKKKNNFFGCFFLKEMQWLAAANDPRHKKKWWLRAIQFPPPGAANAIYRWDSVRSMACGRIPSDGNFLFELKLTKCHMTSWPKITAPFIHEITDSADEEERDSN